MKQLKRVSVILTMSILMFGLYSFAMQENEAENPNCGDVASIEEAGTYSYGSYTSTKYKIKCSCGGTGYIYYNKQNGGWMKTSSSYVDYSSSNTNDGLKKSARVFFWKVLIDTEIIVMCGVHIRTI